MARNPRKRSTRNRRPPRLGGAPSFLLFLIFLLSVLYLWGTVQIDFNQRENDRLEAERRELDRTVNALRIQVNGLKSYTRIVRLAEEQGLVFLPASNLLEISVDLRGAPDLEHENWNIQMAGFSIGEVLPAQTFRQAE